MYTLGACCGDCEERAGLGEGGRYGHERDIDFYYSSLAGVGEGGRYGHGDISESAYSALAGPYDYGELQFSPRGYEPRGLGEYGLGEYVRPRGLGLVVPWGDIDTESASFNPPSGDLGQDAYNMMETLAGAIPVAGPFVSGAMEFAQGLQQWLHLGAGRREADIIVNDSKSGQNLLMQKLGLVTDAIRTGQNPSVEQLRQMWLSVYTMGEIFKRFVLSSQFVDRRASGQALNTVMPYIDGSCGYSVPLGYSATPSNHNCLSWGDGTLGGSGTDGQLGAIGRAIVARGGAIPIPTVAQGPGTSIPTLNYPWPGIPGLPQSGTIPNYGTRPPLQAGIIPIGSGAMTPEVMAAVAVGVVGLLALSRRRGFK